MTSSFYKLSSNNAGWFVFLFLTNLIVKILPVLQGIMIHPDAPVYLWAAQSLEAGNIPAAIQAYPMLLYPFLVMCAHKLGFDWLAAGRAISITASCLALFPFFGLAKKISSGWPAIIITLVFVFLPEYNSIAFAALRDPLYICLSLYSLYFAFLFYEQQKTAWFLLVILSSICLPFLRVEGIVVSIVIIIFSFVWLILHRDPKKRIWTIALLFCFLGILCTIFIFFEMTHDLLRLKQIFSIVKQFNDTPVSLEYYLNKLEELAHNEVRSSGFGNNFWQIVQRNWLWIYVIGMMSMFERNIGWILILLGFIGVKNVVKNHNAGLILPSVFTANIGLIFTKYLYSGSMEGRAMLLPSILWLVSSGAAFSPVVSYISKKCAGVIIFQKKKNVVTLLALMLTVPFAYKTVSMDYNTNIPVLRNGCRWMNEQIIKDGKDWQIWVNLRTIEWLLDRRDLRHIAPRNNQQILTVLKKNQQPLVAIMLLNKGNDKDIALRNKLIKSKSYSFREFNDPKDKKNFVVAVWQEKPIKGTAKKKNSP